jgi:hypothetical protein
LDLVLKRLGEAVIGCRPLSRFVQIDRLVMVKTGAGPTTTGTLRLPRGRYTVFVEYDPPTAVTSFALVDQQDRRLPDWSRVPVDIGEVLAPLVQHELPSGNYRLDIGTGSPGCAWKVQVVLNSMLSWQAPPRPWRASTTPPAEITVRSGESPVFRVAQTGRYDLGWTVGGAQVDGHPIRPYWLDLRATDGHVIHLGGTTSPTRDERTGGAFLGAGEWTVEMKTTYEWQLLIKPVVGPLGGGTRGF